MKLPILFSKSKLNQIIQWEIEVVGDKFRTHEGIVDGKITISEWSQCVSKNLGRANETTAEEQAAAESQSKWAKKAKTGYSPNMEEAGDKSYVQCTLAHSYHDYKDEITFPARGQTKENGARCVITKDGAKSRKGESWVSVPHIPEALKPVFDKFPEAVLDGELLNHDLREQLNMIMKLVRKTKNITPEVLAESKEKIKFYIYDGYGVNSSVSDDYDTRLAGIEKFILENIKDKCIDFIESVEVNSHEDIKNLFSRLTADKFEGEIIRWGKHGYINGRTKHLLKLKTLDEVKPENDDECEILDIHTGRGNWGSVAKTATVKWKDRTFDATLVGTLEEAADVWANKDKWIGRTLTFYFMDFTGLGNPSYPRIKIANCFNDKSDKGIIED